MQATVDVALEHEARRLMCGILYHFDSKHDWPVARQVAQLSGYKAATDKAAVMKYLIDQGWVRVHEAANSHPKGLGFPRKYYAGTRTGREAVLPPQPLPEIQDEDPIPIPDDPVEELLFVYNLRFYRDKGRWPNGEERARAFAGSRDVYSKARRAQAVQNLINDGDLVHVTHRNGKGDTTFLIVPRISPEYADKNGWVFYAPNLTP